MQKMAAPCVSTGSSYSSCLADSADVAAVAAMDQFPAGLRVLVVDDDLTCLKILEHMLLKCRYRVTTCSQAMTALSLLRERKGRFDVVISDVHMPDMDGFKLLELVGLEMDLPVIMMSADGRTSAVMRGITHGACDYLIKPVRIEELKNIWQHVVRKKWIENRDHEHSGSFEDSDNRRRVTDEAENASSGNEGADGSWKAQKKKRDCKEEEDDGELENEDPSASKKPRVVWSVELHQQFVNAVNQLGIDKAVPKRILELMNVPGLTRENVASHLQKFRLYLKRISGVTQHQGALSNSFCNPVEASAKVGSLGRLDFQSFASSGQIPPQTLAALHAELLGRPSSNIALPVLDQPLLLHASSQGPKILPVEREVTFGQPVFKCQSGVSKPFPQAENPIQDMPSTFPSWSSNQLDLTGSTNKLGDLSNSQNNNLFLQILQQSQHQHHEPSYSVVPESHNAINVQPSCLVLPSQSLNSLKAGSSSVPINSNSMVVSTQSSSGFFLASNPMLAPSNSAIGDGGGSFDYGILSSLPNNLPFGVGEVPMPSSALGSSVCTSNGASWRLQSQSANVNIGNVDRLRDHLPSSCIQGTEIKSGLSVSQGQVRNLGFVGKGTCLPSRFAVDDIELPINDQNDPKINLFDDVDQVKQEFVVDFPDGAKVGNTILSNFSSGDFMGVLSK